MRFVVITPGDGRDLVPWLGAVAPWADAVILREPQASADELMRWVDVVRRSGALAIRHARTVAVEADGVHVPDGFVLPDGGVFGVSCHDRAGVLSALEAGATYALLSPVFDPLSKPATHPALGVDGFVQMAGDARVLALGGITVERAEELAQRGFGVAVLGAVFGMQTAAGAGLVAARMWAACRSGGA